MFNNSLKTAWRSLLRQRGYAVVNIAGLALGLASALLLFGHVRADLTWDGWHENRDRIVRVITLQDFGGDQLTDVAVTMAPLGPAMERELPEVERTVRIQGAFAPPVVERGEIRRYQQRVSYVDSSFFDVFTFPLLAGDRSTALSRMDGVVLTRTAADRYFDSDEDPLGQILRLNNRRDAVVTAIAADPPEHGHIRFEMLLPIAARSLDSPGAPMDQWGTNNLATYALLLPGTDHDALGAKITELYHRNANWSGLELYVQRLGDMHLQSGHIEIDINPGRTQPGSVLTMATIALFIMLLAAINSINLATARSLTRAREVGLRKVAGAPRESLIGQFLVESLVTALFATLLAALLVELAVPWFRELAGRDTVLSAVDGGLGTVVLLGLGIAVGFLSGLYPAFVLSSFRPASVLKSASTRGTGGGGGLRRALVVLQFTVSIALLIATGVVDSQVRFGLNKELGFNKEQVLVLPVGDDEFWTRADDHLAAFERIPGLVELAASDRVPSRGGSSSGMTPEGSDRVRVVNWNSVDAGGLEVFGWNLLEGRYFDASRSTDRLQKEDSTGVALLNQAAARQFEWEDPIGKTFRFWGNRFEVIGVIEDYHFQGLSREIEPMVLFNDPGIRSFVSLRYQGDDVAGFVDRVEAVWNDRLPHLPFNSFFLDESFDGYFRSEQRMADVLRAFSGIAVAIAMLGTLGLAAYATSRRTREIAVRKVLGAGEGRILGLLTREFALLIGLANLIAWPLAWYVMERWFSQFAYRAPWPWWVFPAAGGVTLAVALIAVSLQAQRTVRMRPTAALRHE